MNTKPLQRVSLSFGHGSDAIVENTAVAVLANLYGNPAFATPPVTQANLEAALAAFRAAKAAMAQGGTAATAEKNDRKADLRALLRELAFYVQVASANVLATLLSSGFHAVSTNRAQSELPAPAIRSIRNGMTGQLLVEVEVIGMAKCYEVNIALLDAQGTPGPFKTAGLYTAARKMPVNGLTPGTRYITRVRAIGGSTGYSDWSDPVAHMSL